MEFSAGNPQGRLRRLVFWWKLARRSGKRQRFKKQRNCHHFRDVKGDLDQFLSFWTEFSDSELENRIFQRNPGVFVVKIRQKVNFQAIFQSKTSKNEQKRDGRRRRREKQQRPRSRHVVRVPPEAWRVFVTRYRERKIACSFNLSFFYLRFFWIFMEKSFKNDENRGFLMEKVEFNGAEFFCGGFWMVFNRKSQKKWAKKLYSKFFVLQKTF